MTPRMKSALSCVGIVAVAGLAYGMFEPLLQGPFGWQPLPATLPDRTAQQSADTHWYELAERSHALLLEAQQQTNAPALSAAVGLNGKLIWADAIGYADIAEQKPATLDSRFRLGSTSKTITSVAIGTLLQQGKLDLDVPIQRYIPDYPVKEHIITTRQVMSHMAGIRNYQLCWCFPIWETLNTTHYQSMRDSLRPVENDPLEYLPGTQFAYTSHGYNLAGAVLEGAAKQEFVSYINATVLQPLGMTKTGIELHDQSNSDLVQFYELQGKLYKPAFAVDNSNKWPSGGLVSTPSDMVRLGNALLTHQLLTPDISTQLFTPQRLQNGEINSQNYALGWRHSPEWKLLDGKVVTRAIHHGGTATGSTSWFVLYPEYGLTLSIMMNRSADGVRDLIKLGDAIASEYLRQLQTGVAEAPASSAGIGR